MHSWLSSCCHRPRPQLLLCSDRLPVFSKTTVLIHISIGLHGVSGDAFAAGELSGGWNTAVGDWLRCQTARLWRALYRHHFQLCQLYQRKIQVQSHCKYPRHHLVFSLMVMIRDFMLVWFCQVMCPDYVHDLSVGTSLTVMSQLHSQCWFFSALRLLRSKKYICT